MPTINGLQEEIERLKAELETQNRKADKRFIQVQNGQFYRTNGGEKAYVYSWMTNPFTKDVFAVGFIEGRGNTYEWELFGTERRSGDVASAFTLKESW